MEEEQKDEENVCAHLEDHFFLLYSFMFCFDAGKQIKWSENKADFCMLALTKEGIDKVS